MPFLSSFSANLLQLVQNNHIICSKKCVQIWDSIENMLNFGLGCIIYLKTNHCVMFVVCLSVCLSYGQMLVNLTHMISFFLAIVYLFDVFVTHQVVGIILIGMGASALANAGKYSYMFGEENTLQAAAGMTVGVGIIIFLVGFTGCCGACKQSTCLLKIVSIGPGGTQNKNPTGTCRQHGYQNWPPVISATPYFMQNMV